jgi:V8-like Glu-specific endopeptidase
MRKTWPSTLPASRFRNATHDTEPAKPRADRLCCGTDDRERHRANTTYPQAATGFIETGCSGTMISPSTFVTAAHCLYNTANNTWLTVASEPSFGDGSPRFPRFVFSMDGVDADAAPRTHTDVESYDVTLSGSTYTTSGPGAYIQCYDVTVPGGFVSATSGAGSWDFAVVDFKTRCGGNPGNVAGYWGTSVRSESNLEATESRMVGYPGTSTPGEQMNGGNLAGATKSCGTKRAPPPTTKRKCSVASVRSSSSRTRGSSVTPLSTRRAATAAPASFRTSAVSASSAVIWPSRAAAPTTSVDVGTTRTTTS